MSDSDTEQIEPGSGESNDEVPIRADFLRKAFMVGVVLLALAVLFSSMVPAGTPVHLIGRPAPDTNLPLAGGGTMTLGEHLGKDVILLDFWATWCAPCRVSMPIIDQIADDYADRGVVTYFVNQGESAETVSEFARTTGLHSPIAMDLRGQLASAFEVEGIPYTAIIDRSGRIRKIYVGISQNFDQELRDGLEAVLERE